MERLGRADIRHALEALAAELPVGPAPRELTMKLSAWRDDLDVGDARLLLSKIPGERIAVWRQVEPHLVPGRELKAQYAFDDLWEADRGPA